MGVQMIQPESWQDLVGRLDFVRSRPVRWSWIAIRREERWYPYAITVRVPEIVSPSRDLRSDQVWIYSSQLPADRAGDRLLRHTVDEDASVEAFQTQDSYSGFWLAPGTEYGIGQASGWPEYYTTWPLTGPQDPRYSVQWSAPFRVGQYQFKTLAEASFTQLFGQRLREGSAHDLQPGITVRIPYPYRLADVRWEDGRLIVDVDWSGAHEREGLSVHANWRLSRTQADPEAAAAPASARGGSVGFEVVQMPAEAEVFLNDPGVPVPCQDWHWPAEAAAPVNVRLAPDEEDAMVTASWPPQSIASPIDFARLTSDEDMARVLDTRWREVRLCLAADAFVATMVMAGGVLEGALLALARDRPAAASSATSAPKAKDKSVLPLEQWRFDGLIRVATELGWLPTTISGFANAVRSLRNFVHPWEERSAGEAPTEGVAKLAVMTVEQILLHVVDSPPSPGPR